MNTSTTALAMACRSWVDPRVLAAVHESKTAAKEKSAMKNGRLWVKMHLWAKKFPGPLCIEETVFQCIECNRKKWKYSYKPRRVGCVTTGIGTTHLNSAGTSPAIRLVLKAG
jgi:hypothetical protein